MLKGNQNPEPQLINNNTVGITSSTNINEKNKTKDEIFENLKKE